MTDRVPDHRISAWEELQRRRVLRVAVAYVAAAFAGLQAVDLWLASGSAPDWGFRFVLGLAVLGFPIAIVLAWAYDVTPGGIEKTPEDATLDPTYDAGPARRWAVFVVLVTVLGIVLWTLGR